MKFSSIPPEAELAYPFATRITMQPPPGISRNDCGDAETLVSGEYADDGMGAIFRMFVKPSPDELAALHRGGYVQIHLRGQMVPFGAAVFPVNIPAKHEPVLLRGRPDDPKTLEEVVGQAIGAASVCWESMEGTGVFDSDRAKKIADEVIAYVQNDYTREARLGYATTRELLEEITARLEVDGGLDYTTVGG